MYCTIVRLLWSRLLVDFFDFTVVRAGNGHFGDGDVTQLRNQRLLNIL